MIFDTTTTPAQASAMPVMRSARSSADHRSMSSGWIKLSCPMRAMPPAARRLYQATEPRNMLITQATEEDQRRRNENLGRAMLSDHESQRDASRHASRSALLVAAWVVGMPCR